MAAVQTLYSLVRLQSRLCRAGFSILWGAAVLV